MPRGWLRGWPLAGLLGSFSAWCGGDVRGVLNAEYGHDSKWGDVTLTGKAVETEEPKRLLTIEGGVARFQVERMNATAWRGSLPLRYKVYNQRAHLMSGRSAAW